MNTPSSCLSPSSSLKDGDPSGQHVVVGLSGGVDSAVSAYLLKQQGYTVSGLLARCWDVLWERDAFEGHQGTGEDSGTSHEPLATECPDYERDYQDVAYTCAQLDIPFYTIDLREAYRNEVFEHLIAGIKKGHTPNPDIMCNRHIKFDHLVKYAFSLDADYFATGHYCQTDGRNLQKGADPGKDQSYFLYAIPSKILARVMFPVGGMLKSEVREIAQKAGLEVHDKKDSVGLCFVGKRSFAEFISGFIPPKPGRFINLSGEHVGDHNGAHLYTLGQRRHLGLGGTGERWFVTGKDMNRNIVFVHRGDHPALHQQELWLREVRWLDGEFVSSCVQSSQQPQAPIQLKVKVRYRAPEVKALLTPPTTSGSTEDSRSDLWQLIFAEEQKKPIAPGQSVVFYRGEQCLGGGVVAEHGSGL